MMLDIKTSEEVSHEFNVVYDGTSRNKHWVSVDSEIKELDRILDIFNWDKERGIQELKKLIKELSPPPKEEKA